MDPQDQVTREIQATFNRRKLVKAFKLFGLVTIIVVCYYVSIYAYAAARIAQSKEDGVYPTAEVAALGTYGQGWKDVQVLNVDVVDCGPNNPDGKPAHIWFCTAWIKLDRIPRGFHRSTYLAGGFFIHVRDGWVFMSEGSFPGFVGGVMELYHMEGIQ